MKRFAFLFAALALAVGAAACGDDETTTNGDGGTGGATGGTTDGGTGGATGGGENLDSVKLSEVTEAQAKAMCIEANKAMAAADKDKGYQKFNCLEDKDKCASCFTGDLEKMLTSDCTDDEAKKIVANTKDCKDVTFADVKKCFAEIPAPYQTDAFTKLTCDSPAPTAPDMPASCKTLAEKCPKILGGE